ncbi:MAG TPA: IS3 family transposase [Solirubrobacteraceae bacterium]|nr:IS3 family transposase [Solirubrobacteraceae bacterium]
MIEALAGQGHSAKALCRMLGVAPSGYFHWRGKPPGVRELRRAQLRPLIADIHHASMGTYGVRRIVAELRFDHEIVANRKAVQAIMRSLGLQGLPKRKAHRRGPPTEGAAACDLVLRSFGAEAPNRLWLTDITEHPTREGKLYCCVVLDAYSRSVVGWSIDNSQPASLVTSALGMAIGRRKPIAGGIVHADHGSQFTSWAFSERVKSVGLELSMGRVGDAYDNAMMEAFWARMQVELLNRKRWRTRLELANAIFEYVEVFHNRRRRHSALGMLTPSEYDNLYTPTLAA